MDKDDSVHILDGWIQRKSYVVWVHLNSFIDIFWVLEFHSLQDGGSMTYCEATFRLSFSPMCYPSLRVSGLISTVAPWAMAWSLSCPFRNDHGLADKRSPRVFFFIYIGRVYSTGILHTAHGLTRPTRLRIGTWALEDSTLPPVSRPAPHQSNSNSSFPFDLEASRLPRPTQQRRGEGAGCKGEGIRSGKHELGLRRPSPSCSNWEIRRIFWGEPHRRWPRTRRRTNQIATAPAPVPARRGSRSGGRPRHGESSSSASSASPPPVSRWVPLSSPCYACVR